MFYSAAVAFGGLMGDKTGNLIGISETLIVSSVSGDSHHNSQAIVANMMGQDTPVPVLESAVAW